MTDLTKLTVSKLLRLNAGILSELKERDIIRSANNPTGDLAEYLFAKAFKWELASNSEAHFDAIDKKTSKKYQIKGRRLVESDGSRLLGALRNLGDDKPGFDFLAGVLFDEYYTVIRAALISHQTILKNSKYNEHTNSWRFYLRDEVWNLAGVTDVTERLKSVRL